MTKPNASLFTVGQQVRNIVRFGSMEYDAVVMGVGERELVVRNIGAKDNYFIIYFTMQTVIGNTIIAKGAIHPHSKSPELVGVQEAAKILGWDKRRVATYISRGSFPDPIQRLASGSIWTKRQILDYQSSIQSKEEK